MAKKKAQKKHNFKYAQPTDLVNRGAGSSVANLKESQAGAAVNNGGRDFGYVARDLRRVGVLAVSLITFQVVLWYLFNHTGLGTSVYSVIKL